MYDRDRDRQRERDRGDAYRPRRSPPREPYGISAADTYTPSAPRGPRRSRSPPPSFRRRSPARDSNWRDNRRPSPLRDNRRSSPPRDNRRPSPPTGPRRGYSPPRRDDDRGRFRDEDRRDGRFRSPVRENRDRFARSPPRRERSRSPIYAKRQRDYSPVDRNRPRSPPPKRERISSPPRRYDSPPRRPHSPPHGPRADREFNRRDRSRSPRRDDRRDPDRQRDYEEPSAPISATTSRRSSPPPIHPERLRQIAPEERDGRTARSPYQSPALSPALKKEPPREADYGRDRDRDIGDRGADSRDTTLSYRNGDTSRAPPSGPASTRVASGRFSPPSGPAASSVTAHNRFNNPILSAPSRPRGARGGFSGSYRGDFGGPSPRRGDFGRGGGYFGGPPRGGFVGSFRGSSNSSSATYPHTQRFNSTSSVNKYLGDLPQIVPGGQRAPPRDAAAESRIRRLEEEAEKLRNQIADKQKTKRTGLKEWNRLSAETESTRLRGEFAEENLRKMNGEESEGPAF